MLASVPQEVEVLQDVPEACLSLEQEVKMLQTQPRYRTGGARRTFCKLLLYCWHINAQLGGGVNLASSVGSHSCRSVIQRGVPVNNAEGEALSRKRQRVQLFTETPLWTTTSSVIRKKSRVGPPGSLTAFPCVCADERLEELIRRVGDFSSLLGP